MSRYPLIEKMGLRIFPANSISKTYVDCEALEAALEKAHVIYSTREPENGSAKWDEGYKISHTHQALLICVEKIKREPVKVEFEQTVCELSRMMDGLGTFYLFHDSMKSLAGKKVRVTVEELP